MCNNSYLKVNLEEMITDMTLQTDNPKSLIRKWLTCDKLNRNRSVEKLY